MKKHFIINFEKTEIVIFCIFMLITFLVPVAVHAWGSLAPAQTHQYILQQAYKKLSADPAFDPKLFPTIEEIINHEGVVWARYKWTGEGYIGLGVDYNVLSGPGPDSRGASNFSEHYYNPKLGRGGAPDSISRYYRYLAEGILTSKKEALPKAAAWGAHYLSDMFCPYHVIGADRSTIQAIYEEQNTKHKDSIYLQDEIKGSVKLAYLTPVKFLSNNFNTEVTRYLTKSNEDWFDPWYYNGDTELAMSETSSHIAWETTIGHNGTGLSGYDPSWKNSPKTFDKPWMSQAEQVRRLTVSSATETYSRITSYFDNPEPAINNAIQAVATVWRASLSAIKPSLESTQEGEHLVVRGKVSNKGNAELRDIEARLTSADCPIDPHQAIQKISSIAAGQASSTQPWRIKGSGDACKLKLETIGNYGAPDLQYAMTTSAAKTDDVPSTDKTELDGLSVEILQKLKATVRLGVNAYGPIIQTSGKGENRKLWENIHVPHMLFFAQPGVEKKFLKWSGNAFSALVEGKRIVNGVNKRATLKVEGAIAADGKSILNLRIEEYYIEEGISDVKTLIQIATTPLDQQETQKFAGNGLVIYQLRGEKVKSSLIKAEMTSRQLMSDGTPRPDSTFNRIIKFYDDQYSPQILVTFAPLAK